VKNLFFRRVRELEEDMPEERRGKGRRRRIPH